jgi:hypothetical protein
VAIMTFPANTVYLPANAISGEKKTQQSWKPNTSMPANLIIKCSTAFRKKHKLYQYVRLKKWGHGLVFIASLWHFCAGRKSPFDAKKVKLAQYLPIF